MGRHVSAVQWLEWVERQPESGLTVAEFCDAVGVSPQSFYRWRRKLDEAGGSDGGNGNAGDSRASPGATDRSVTQTFLPLHVIASPRVEIELPCGAVMRVPPEQEILGEVILALMQTPKRLIATDQETSSC